MSARRRRWECRRGSRLGATTLRVEIEVKNDMGLGARVVIPVRIAHPNAATLTVIGYSHTQYDIT